MSFSLRKQVKIYSVLDENMFGLVQFWVVLSVHVRRRGHDLGAVWKELSMSWPDVKLILQTNLTNKQTL